MKIKLRSILMAAGLLGVAAAQAMTTSTILIVSATVGAACSVSTTPVVFSSLAFGTTASGSVTVNCPTNTIFTVTMDAGLHNDGAGGSRQLANNGVAHPYSITYGGNQWGDMGYGNTFPYPGVNAVSIGGDMLLPVWVTPRPPLWSEISAGAGRDRSCNGRHAIRSTLAVSQDA